MLKLRNVTYSGYMSMMQMVYPGYGQLMLFIGFIIFVFSQFSMYLLRLVFRYRSPCSRVFFVASSAL